MTTIVRRRKLGLTSIKGIIEASQSATLRYANNYEHIPHDDVYIRWGCTSNLPNPKAEVINAAKGIHRVADKSGFRYILNERNLCPETWWHIEDVMHLIPNTYERLIVRSRTHAQGRGMWVCETPGQLAAAVREAGPGCYINEFIDKTREFRVFVCQGRIVWVAEKTPANPDDVAWNVAKGGRFDNVRWGDWPLDVIQNALEVWRLTGLHFAGIDMMMDADGVAYCVEANSAPSQTSPYRQSCVAKAFDWMQATGVYQRRAFNPVVVRDWKDAIHPAVRGGA
jgi:glutathione synthase/RimK-type ligase-like ATP-grasp enzyme